MGKPNALLTFWRKYKIVIFFPTFTASTIYADYSHTQKWKQENLKPIKNKELLVE